MIARVDPRLPDVILASSAIAVALRNNNLVFLILGYGFPIAHFGEKCLRLECGLPTLLHEEALFPGRSQNHVRQSGINSGNHTAIPTPEIDFLAGVTLTHFYLVRNEAALRMAVDRRRPDAH